MPPLYDYRCRDGACKKLTTAVRKIAERDNAPACKHCGANTRKIISLSRAHPDMTPYFDDNLQTYIKGRQHREKVMKEKGVSEAYGKGWI